MAPAMQRLQTGPRWDSEGPALGRCQVPASGGPPHPPSLAGKRSGF